MNKQGENEGFRILEEVVCSASNDTSASAISATRNGQNEGIRVVDEIVVDLGVADPRIVNEQVAEVSGEPVEQKVVSVLLNDQDIRDREKKPEEHFANYLSEGWKVKQVTAISTGAAHGWIIALLEKEANQPRRRTVVA